MAGVFRKLRLLVWKNFILQIRRPIGTAVEILLPIAFLSLLILARQLVKNKEKCFSTFNHLNIPRQDYINGYVEKLKGEKILVKGQLAIAYYPHTQITTKLIEKVARGVSVSVAYNDSKGNSFASKDDLLNEVKEFTDKYLGAIIFENVEANKPFPKTVEYSIRLHHSTAELYDSRAKSWMTRFVYPFFQQASPRQSSFYLSPFLSLQYFMDSAILQHYTNTNYTVAEDIQQFPYPDYIEDTFIQVIQGTMPLVFVLAYVYTAVMIVKELVAEKQCRLKESMKMMGLANWVHWTAWFIKIFLFLFLSIIIQTAILKGGKIFEFADTGVVFVFLLLYFLSTIFYLFFCSVFFSNAIRGMLFAAVFWLCKR